MKKYLLLLVAGLVLTCAIYANAQAQQPKSDPVLTAEQQQEFQTALKNFQAAQQALKQAETQSELAFAKLQQVIYKAMAEIGIDPKKYEAQLGATGNLTFTEKSKTAQTNAPSTNAPRKP